MDEETINTFDQSVSREVEESFGGGSYYFSTAQDPNPDKYVYQNCERFTVAMLNQASPTLLVFRGKYATITKTELEILSPFAFPYGIGTPKQKSEQIKFPSRHVYSATCGWSCYNSKRDDAILVMNHMYGCQAL